MISLAPISVEEMMAPWSQQRGVWTGTGRLICLTRVWLTQLQTVSGEGTDIGSVKRLLRFTGVVVQPGEVLYIFRV